MPLAFNRNFQGMMVTIPGASQAAQARTPSSSTRNDSLSSEVNGQSRLANNVQIEGTRQQPADGPADRADPPAEAIDKVSITT